jgi:hypothetical protein
MATTGQGPSLDRTCGSTGEQIEPLQTHRDPFFRNGRTASARPDRLWAVTAYFDPFGDRQRLPAYREFRRRLRAPLVAVEISFGDTFDLQEDDADIVVRLQGGAVLWQKERLLNLALRALPDHATAVAWLDCDIVFLREDWPEDVLRGLEESVLIQPFSHLHYLPSAEASEAMHTRRSGEDGIFDSIAYRFANGKLPDEAYRVSGGSGRLRYAPGMAWAARRETLERSELYDAAVLGGGDKYIFAAAMGRHDDLAASIRMNHVATQHYHAWAERFADIVHGRISYVEGDLLHLWHGDLSNRRYVERFSGFERYEFDPARDLARTPQGAWCWNSDKPQLHAFVRRQLALRAGHAAC